MKPGILTGKLAPLDLKFTRLQKTRAEVRA